MPKRKNEQNYASTPMGEMFRVGFKPVRSFFNDIAARAQSSFWKMNDKLNQGVTLDDDRKRRK